MVNKIMEKYSNEIAMLKSYFINDLKFYDVCGIYIYGSAINIDLFDEIYSDIDVIVFLKEFNKYDIQALVDKIKNSGLIFKEKQPQFICDSLCPRIEFCIHTNRIDFDVTISGGLIPEKKALVENACYDGFEALMGGVYVNSYHLYGEAPDWTLFTKEFYPFYSDSLRYARLEAISERIQRYNTRVKSMWGKKNLAAYDHIYKLRKLLIKYIFIVNRTYYYTPEKNLFYQLSSISEMSEEDIKAICFMGDYGYGQIIERFTNIVDKVLDNKWED